MKRVLFLSNIPTPYRNDFYNELGKYTDLTVIYEAESAQKQGIRFNFHLSQIKNYKAIFLKDGDIVEEKVNFKVFKYLKKSYDHIFVTNYSYRTEMAALIYLKICQKPYTMEVDGGIIKDDGFFKKKLKTFLISGAESYFSPSKGTDAFLTHYGAVYDLINRISFSSLHQNQILAKTPLEDDKKSARQDLGITGETVIVGVGQLIHRKGWDTLIKIAPFINAEIYIVGEGELREYYIKMINDLKAYNVHLVGFQSNETTNKYYKSADIFVLPTREDIWGLVVNEALANALPTITTTSCVAGLELIKNDYNGYLIPPENSDKLKILLTELIQKKDKRYIMSENALKSIKKHTLEQMVFEHLELLEATKL